MAYLYRAGGFFVVVFSVVAIAGCGGSSSGPQMATVTGTVLFDGQPLSEAEVVFSPEAGPSSSARTDEQGNFTLVGGPKQKGAVVGSHTVRISTYQPPQPIFGDRASLKQGELPEVVGTSPEKPETVPSKYNSESTLTKTVEPGKNAFTIELTSN
ncbi:DUF4198 domain-containing protein [Stratiformator vulcanicus]|uniref:Nickel uptake substrate-specific transmembrane region n=1 Tax=Stratiformator vulcanicus TaxID=2527980 RepID=A0A517QVV9_9PLAN|nr:DUF4198 domain-containing protein [Stratiformator vulcanicus]QDT35750.1 hypothetical protein Pan189_01030 [Stratiformator vulcanicus]